MDSCNCKDIRDALSEKIATSKFGKIVQQCPACSRVWTINKVSMVPTPIDTDERQQEPPSNRLAFINDPRRRNPR